MPDPGQPAPPRVLREISTTPALVVRGLRKLYGSSEAIAGVDFEVREREIFGLLGANGAGKTTTISILSTETRPTEGDALLFGHSVCDEPGLVRQMIGIVPQGLALYPKLTAAENLRFFGRMYGVKSGALEDRIHESLRFVRLERQRDQLAAVMSGGMKRRLNIAIALVHEPRLILMDEATVGVDPNAREHIFEIVRALRDSGAAIVYTTHYLDEAERLCDRIGIMHEGKLMVTGRLESLLADSDYAEMIEICGLPSEIGLAALLGPEGISCIEQSAHATRLYVKSATPFLEPLRRIMARFGPRVRLRIEPVGLNSIFRSLTGKDLND